MANDKDTIGDRIRAIREQRGRTIAQLADEAGINKSQISRYESGIALPLPDALRRICDALRVHISAIFPSERIVWNAAAINAEAQDEWLRYLCKNTRCHFTFSRYSGQGDRKRLLPGWIDSHLSEAGNQIPVLSCIIWRREDLAWLTLLRMEEFREYVANCHRHIFIIVDNHWFDTAVECVSSDMNRMNWSEISVLAQGSVVVTHDDAAVDFGWHSSKADALVRAGIRALNGLIEHTELADMDTVTRELLASVNSKTLNIAGNLFKRDRDVIEEAISRAREKWSLKSPQP